ncbi:MAG: FAD-dependent oxidoreductase, partial [Bacteroidales bacterium]|nr:FAD-dependent oxidoreductase [Bacteroidales bacterium]
QIEPLRKSEKNQGKIAIIGCGPAGVCCAAELAKMNYDVTIFEREDMAGGVPKWNIPEFRLPAEAIAYDVENLLSLGVDIRFNATIENNEAISMLLAEGYMAVFISTGLSVALKIDLFDNYINALDYISFLRSVKFDHNNIDLKNKNVAVIGGGSVAVDSAVSAKACGANKVYLISLEHLDELPADKGEIELAHEMNITFKAGCQITDVNANEKIITGLKGMEVEWIKPENFSPSNVRKVEGTTFALNVDLVVQAIGTKPGYEISRFHKSLQTRGKGIIEVNDLFETNLEGVFAGGDVVNAGSTVVQAVGEGKKAALSIDNYLKNRENKA